MVNSHSLNGTDGRNPSIHSSIHTSCTASGVEPDAAAFLVRLHRALQFIFNKGFGLEWGLKSEWSAILKWPLKVGSRFRVNLI